MAEYSWRDRLRKRGLIDTIGHLQDALDAARTLAGRPSAATVILHRKKTMRHALRTRRPQNVPLQASLLGVSVPAGGSQPVADVLVPVAAGPEAWRRMSGK